MKSFLIAFLICSLFGCSTSRPARVSEVTLKPWEKLRESCELDKINYLVTCPGDVFVTAGLDCINLARRLEHCKEDLSFTLKSDDISRSESRGLLIDCQNKLRSPWRSPYLWAAIGLCVGGVIGVGVSLGTK